MNDILIVHVCICSTSERLRWGAWKVKNDLRAGLINDVRNSFITYSGKDLKNGFAEVVCENRKEVYHKFWKMVCKHTTRVPLMLLLE